MNKLIEKLAHQAGYLPDGFGIGHWDMPECQKLVELVVKECCAVIEKEGMNMVPGHVMRLTVPTEIQLIKEHFGIDEPVDDVLRNRSTYFGHDL